MLALTLICLTLLEGNSTSAENLSPPANTDAYQVLIVRGPGVTCYSRFLESLQQDIVDKHDQIFAVQIRPESEIVPWMEPLGLDTIPDGPAAAYDTTTPDKLVREPVLWGEHYWMFFKVSRDLTKDQFLTKLPDSRIYGMRQWILIQPFPVQAVQNDPNSDQSKSTPDN